MIGAFLSLSEKGRQPFGDWRQLGHDRVGITRRGEST
jgi:hypothetical protein